MPLLMHHKRGAIELQPKAAQCTANFIESFPSATGFIAREGKICPLLMHRKRGR